MFVERTGAIDRMNVYGEAKASSLNCNVVEQIVLQFLIVGSRGLATFQITRVDAPGGGDVCLLEIQLTQISGFKLHRDRTISFFRLQRGCNNRG